MPHSTTDLPTVPTPFLWPWLKSGCMLLLAVAWAVGAHVASASESPSGWGAALALAPVLMAAALALWSLPQRWVGVLGALALAGLLVAVWSWLSERVALLFYLEHLGVYILMAVVFGRTLRGPGDSLVTQIARRVHGGVLSPRQLVYTRQVTLAWTLFFSAMALASTTLFVLAPTAVWSTFANLFGGPLIGLMFLAEFVWRRRALAGEDQASFADAIRAWKAHNTQKTP